MAGCLVLFEIDLQGDTPRPWYTGMERLEVLPFAPRAGLSIRFCDCCEGVHVLEEAVWRHNRGHFWVRLRSDKWPGAQPHEPLEFYLRHGWKENPDYRDWPEEAEATTQVPANGEGPNEVRPPGPGGT